MERRKFLQVGMTGMAALSLGQLFGCGDGRDGDSLNDPPGQPPTAPEAVAAALAIEEALFEMIDGTLVYGWAFRDQNEEGTSLPRLPGPVIRARAGQTVEVTVTNNLPHSHGFAIHDLPGTEIVVPPGETRVLTFTAPAAGTYLYLDPLNAPVNRVLGLHGALVVLPAAGNTPYSAPTPAVQQLFDDLGTTAHYPPHATSPPGWQPERDRIWLFHQIDPSFHARAESGETLDPAELEEDFLPRYFLINGRSGAFAAHNPETTLTGRVGQPMLVRQLNAGLFTHSPHLHANHFYVTAVNNRVQENVWFIDTFGLGALDRIDWLVPFHRPPDIPGGEEVSLRELIPNELALTIDGPNGAAGVPQSPLLYPMHCHNEVSQTAAGGNYPQGAVLHFEFLGDIDGVDFPGAHGEGES